MYLLPRKTLTRRNAIYIYKFSLFPLHTLADHCVHPMLWCVPFLVALRQIGTCSEAVELE